MELTKEQTYQLLFNSNKHRSINNKYSYTTKFRWRCLGCMKDIYIRYDSCSRQSIFCPACYNKVYAKPTIAQYQYIRKLKEIQLEFTENYINKFLDSVESHIK